MEHPDHVPLLGFSVPVKEGSLILGVINVLFASGFSVRFYLSFLGFLYYSPLPALDFFAVFITFLIMCYGIQTQQGRFLKPFALLQLIEVVIYALCLISGFIWLVGNGDSAYFGGNLIVVSSFRIALCLLTAYIVTAYRRYLEDLNEPLVSDDDDGDVIRVSLPRV